MHKRISMKKTTAIIIALLLSINVFAQFEPNTNWPYVYLNFTEGTLKMPIGVEKKALFNVHLAHSTLHFIEGNAVKQVSPSDIFGVQIGNDYYINANGMMMKVLAQNDNGVIALSQEVDVAALNSTDAAYGSGGATLGNMSLSSLESIGVGNGIVNNTLTDKDGEKENGKVLPLIEKIFIVSKGKVIYATKKDVTAAIGADALKAFLKTNKIKWTDPQSLLTLMDYIAENK